MSYIRGFGTVFIIRHKPLICQLLFQIFFH